MSNMCCLEAAGEPEATRTHGRRSVAAMNYMVHRVFWPAREAMRDCSFQAFITLECNHAACQCAIRKDYMVPCEAFEEDLQALFDQIVWCDNAPDGKIQMTTYRRNLGIRAHPVRKGRMRRLSYEWLVGLREIVIDSRRCPLIFAEFSLKEFMRDREGSWIDEIPDGNDHSIDAIRYMMLDDLLRR